MGRGHPYRNTSLPSSVVADLEKRDWLTCHSIFFFESVSGPRQAGGLEDVEVKHG